MTSGMQMVAPMPTLKASFVLTQLVGGTHAFGCLHHNRHDADRHPGSVAQGLHQIFRLLERG